MMQVTQDLPPKQLPPFRAKRGAGKFCFPLRKADGLMIHFSSDKPARIQAPNKSFPPDVFSVEMTCARNSGFAHEGLRRFDAAHDPVRAKTRFRVPITLFGETRK